MEDKRKNNKTFSLLNVLVGVLVSLIVISFLLSVISSRQPNPRLVHQLRCSANLHQLCLACFIYNDMNKKQVWLEKDKWCDVLGSYYEPEYMECPEDKIGPCSYAMNKNIPANVNELPSDLVILFESTPGWNQIGGPNDVVTDRHKNTGANIVFANGDVGFIGSEDIHNLRWKIEKEKLENKQNKEK